MESRYSRLRHQVNLLSFRRRLYGVLVRTVYGTARGANGSVYGNDVSLVFRDNFCFISLVLQWVPISNGATNLSFRQSSLRLVNGVLRFSRDGEFCLTDRQWCPFSLYKWWENMECGLLRGKE